MPELQSVESSSIAAIGYDAARRHLRVQFHDDDLYVYFDVPPEEYEAFMGAPSKGEFFNARIRPRHGWEKK